MAEAVAPERQARLAGAAVAAAALAAGVPALNRLLVGVFYDDGLYAGLALALASGQGYVHPHLPGTPAAVHYPPLYPLVLAPLFGALPLDAAGFAGKLLNLLLAALGPGLIAWHAVRSGLLGDDAPRPLAAAVVGAAAVAIPVLATQAVLFAEPLFGVLLAGAVILADTRVPARGSALWAGLAAALALLTRSIGVAAGAGIVLFQLAVRRVPWRHALITAGPVAAASIAWGLWVLAHEGGIDPALTLNYGSYGATLRQAGFAALGVSAPDLARPLAALTLGWLPAAPYYVFGAAALAVGIYGLVLLARRSAIGFTLVFYLAILAIWPYPPDRFLWAVLPWLALAWAAGAAALWRHRRLRLPVAVVAATLAVGYVIYEARGFAGRWWEGAASTISANFTELLPGLGELEPGSVLACDDEALVWLYTRHPAVPLYLYRYRGRETVEPAPAEHRAYLERQGVTHIVLASATSGSARQLRALIRAYPDWLTPVHRWPRGRWMYRVNRER